MTASFLAPRHGCRIALVFLLLAAGVPGGNAADTPSPNPLLLEAEAAFQKGRKTNALALVSKAIAANPNDVKALALRGRFHSESRQPAQAVADFDEVLKLDPNATQIYQLRGVEQFRLGHFKESVADFDEVIKRMPDRGPQHWQRGISCYYAGMFNEGRIQFESHQTVNAHDVENAVWHFLCVARASGVTAARAALIPISGDSRVPMMEVHALFAGKAKPEDVLAAAQAGRPARDSQQLFYAHLYLGLYYEALGDAGRARQHIFKAADDFSADHYMGDVARVHAQLLRSKEPERK
jgi:lipoprotein NlpI